MMGNMDFIYISGRKCGYISCVLQVLHDLSLSLCWIVKRNDEIHLESTSIII